MTLFLVLTAEQAAICSGEFCPGKAISPRPLVDGRFALPTRLLDLPECPAAFPLLSLLSVEELMSNDFLTEE